jgi:SAM-dependent methyltransferase
VSPDEKTLRLERKVARLLEEQERMAFVLERQRRLSTPCCLNCGQARMQLEGEFVDASHTHHIWRCDSCLLSQLERRLTESEVADLEDTNLHYQVDDEDIEEKVREHSFILNLLHRHQRGSRLLEVGSSRGYKLEAARRAGWTVEGIELSRVSYQFARQRMRLPIHLGTVESYVPTHGFDAAIAWHVLEHVPSPTSFLNNLNDLLDNGGCLLIQVPSYGMFRDLKPWSAHPENFCQVHYWYFTVESLRSLLIRSGFEPEFECDDSSFRHLTFVARRTGAPSTSFLTED